jgi:hypothetical protein
MKTKIVFPLLFLTTTSAVPQSLGSFTATGSMAVARANHTATLLPNGKVLVAGGAIAAFGGSGFGAPTASTEIYDPSTGIFTSAENMTTPRVRHTATLLPDGRVLIAGGSHERPVSAELYDPLVGTFSTANNMIVGGVGLATRLPDGRVMIAHETAAELYDAVTGQFVLAAPYPHDGPGILGTITSLANGRVLLTGCPTRCETGVNWIYDPERDTFSITGALRTFYDVNTATLMTDGRVLFVGSVENDGFPSNATIYDVARETFAAIGHTSGAHQFSAATLLSDGTVLITGGQLPGGSGSENSDLYIPSPAIFSATRGMTTARHEHISTLLLDGTVLIAGGYSVWPNPTAKAEIYRPDASAPAAALLSLSGDGKGQGAIQHADTFKIASPETPAVTGEALLIYCTGLIDGSVIPPQVAIGGRLAEVLWFGNTPGSPGLKQVNVRLPDGVAPGPAVPVRLTYMGRPSNEVTISVQ